MSATNGDDKTTTPPPTPNADSTTTPKMDQMHHHVVPTERCGAINVYVQGDLEDIYKDKDNKCVFMTIHDIGSNHSTFKKFVDHEAFEEIKKRSVFIHINIPGQEDGASKFPDNFTFPTLQNIGEDLVTVLDQLRIKHVVAMGDGAGANIAARFGMMHVTRCLGVLLIHPVSNTSSMMENFKDRVTKWKLNNIAADGENMLILRRFGHKIQDKEDKIEAMEDFKRKLHNDINSDNLKCYMNAYMNRTDIGSLLGKNLRCDALLVVGSRSSQVAAAERMHSFMDKSRSSLLKIDEVGNVLEEAPGKLAQSILLFCKGLGWLTSVNLPGVERRASVDSQGKGRRQRSISMEEYDKPNIRRLSITSKE